jgi:V-type H+-transporting ATPase subunit E
LADEEFHIEKGKLVRQESSQIEAFFQKKVKQSDIQRKISHSHLINKSRLQVLGAKQQSLQDVFMETKSKLVDLTRNAEAYQSLLVNLLLQGFYRLMEPSVMIQVRQQDVSIVQSAIESACKEYEKTLGIKIVCIIDEKNPLPSTSCGGVILGSLDWTIKCSNTLESRLELLQDQVEFN